MQSIDGQQNLINHELIILGVNYVTLHDELVSEWLKKITKRKNNYNNGGKMTKSPVDKEYYKMILKWKENCRPIIELKMEICIEAK